MMNTLDLFNIKKSILSKIDKEIVNHGDETAYIVYRILKELDVEDEYIYSMCILASIHDIGAYKSDELSKIKEFEIKDKVNHSAYGYCILNQYENFKDLASIILYHHHPYNKDDITIDNIKVPKEAYLISLADRISILCESLNYDYDKIKRRINKLNKNNYDNYYFERLIDLVNNKDLIRDIIDKQYTNEMYDMFKERKLSTQKLKNHLIYVFVAIDFFSLETSLHTVSVGCCTEQICNFMNVEDGYRSKVEIASYLHDLGKVCIPKEILEKKVD